MCLMLTKGLQWAEEIAAFCAGIPVILASLKNDLRSSEIAIDGMSKGALQLVTELEGQLVSLEIGAEAYIQCSSLSGVGVDDVFEAAFRAAISHSKKCVNSRCVVF